MEIESSKVNAKRREAPPKGTIKNEFRFARLPYFLLSLLPNTFSRSLTISIDTTSSKTSLDARKFELLERRLTTPVAVQNNNSNEPKPFAVVAAAGATTANSSISTINSSSFFNNTFQQQQPAQLATDNLDDEADGGDSVSGRSLLRTDNE